MGDMTAVFVHGVPETPAVWHGLLAALDRPDTVALSLPGFDSARPAGFGATMEEYADWLAAQLERLGGPKDWHCEDIRFYLAFLSIDRLQADDRALVPFRQ